MKLGYNFLGDRAKLKFYHYANLRALPPPPKETSNGLALVAPNQMFGNDTVGDCTCADIANAIKLNTAMGAGEFVASTTEVLALYNKLTGGVDSGLSLSQAADGAMKYGLGGHKLHAYLDLPIGDVPMMQQTIFLFHGGSVGVTLPKSAMDTFGQGKIWSVVGDTRILGGHDMFAVDYNEDGPIFKTWAGDQPATWDWLAYYAMEQQARLYDDAAGQNWNDANGFSFTDLANDLANL